MKVKIEINVETITDLYTALGEIKKHVKRQATINKANPKENDFPAGTCLPDSNCYGDYELEVFEDQ